MQTVGLLPENPTPKLRALTVRKPWAFFLAGLVMDEWWDENEQGSLKFVENRSYTPKLNAGDWVIVHVGKGDESKDVIPDINEMLGANIPVKDAWPKEFTGKLIAALRYSHTIRSDEECPEDQLFWYSPDSHGWFFDLCIPFDELLDGHKGNVPLLKLSPELQAAVWNQINPVMVEIENE